MRYATSQIRNLVILTSSFFLLSACGQQTSPTKAEATKQDTAVSKDSAKAENSTTTKNNAKTENNTKPEAESKNTQKEQQPAKQPNKQTDTNTFTSEDAIKVLEKRMGARSNEIRYSSSEDKLIGTLNGIKLYDVLYGRESPENSRALNFAVGSDGNLYDWSKAQDGILQPLNGN
ncbi:hypothetical protein A6283_00860 [Bacillus wiedmannii]|uniref:Lipoprotein n=1 Tax=Bacillus cereus group sp. MS39 TaxID=3041344 RepID=A0AAU8F742_9BACI|nr:hypothetical protein [Bacillus wiedmannii]MCT6914842.1 hypothetical protein [Bacillus wiedmannii]OAK30008.1 hypothetical protein A6283_00860 [Bacillus wiedmannii]PHB74896.1 hypothetical protein COE89_09030 [Bacillus wiedmannii]